MPSEKYYRTRLTNQNLRWHGQVSARCIFHDDRKSSLSNNANNGKWYCHGPCSKGGHLVEFEQEFYSQATHQQLPAFRISGPTSLHLMNGKAEKMSPSARNDLEGPRLLPQNSEPAGSLTGFGWVSLADTAMKVWETSDHKSLTKKPKQTKRSKRWRLAG